MLEKTVTHVMFRLREGGKKTEMHIPGGGRFDPPCQESLCELPNYLAEIQKLAKKVRKQATPTDVQRVGELLYRALVPPAFDPILRDAVPKADGTGYLRLEIDPDEVESPEIAALPWEFLRAPDTSKDPGINFATHSRLAFSRRHQGHALLSPILLDGLLRIQLIVVQPAAMAGVEYRDIESALQELAQDHPDLIALPLPVLLNPAMKELDDTLKERNPHLLHIITHGRIKKGQGQIALVNQAKKVAWKASQEFVTLFESYAPRVVLLQACESGATPAASTKIFAGLASRISHQKIPAVVAMQYPINNAEAVTFSKTFYQQIGARVAVDLAVQAARRRLSLEPTASPRDPATPMIYLRVQNGQLFTNEPAAPHRSLARFSGPQIQALPLPLAGSCELFNQAQNEPDQFYALDRLLRNLVKYLMAVAFSQYWRDEQDSERMRTRLGELSEIRLSSVLRLLDQVCKEYARKNASSPLEVLLFQPYRAPVSENSALAGLYDKLRQLSAPRLARDENITTGLFLERLLDLRQEKWEAYVWSRSLPAQEVENYLALLYAGVTSLLDCFRELLSYPLYYLERYDRHGQDIAYTRVSFPSNDEAREEREPYLEKGVQTPSYKTLRLYLFTPSGAPLVCLYPLIISHHYRLHYLERGGEQPTIAYRNWRDDKLYTPPDHVDFLRFTQTGCDKNLCEKFGQVDEAIVNSEDCIVDKPVAILWTHFDPDTIRALQMGLGEALRLKHFWLGIEFLLMGLSRQEDNGLFQEILAPLGISPRELRGSLRNLAGVKNKDWRELGDVEKEGAAAWAALEKLEASELQQRCFDRKIPRAVLTPRLLQVFQKALELAKDKKITPDHLLLAALQRQHYGCRAVKLILSTLYEKGKNPQTILEQLAWRAGVEQPDLPNQDQTVALDWSRMLPKKVVEDLIAQAKAGKLQPVSGERAHATMLKIVQILLQAEANVPVLLGDPGVGKTAIVKGLALRFANHQIAGKLARSSMIELSLGSMLAGAPDRGDFEADLQKLVETARKANRQIILFIDEIHTVLAGNADRGIADVLKQALDRGDFLCIGATTAAEYRRYIVNNPALARCFTPLWIEEPDPDEALAIAREVVAKRYQPFHRVQYADEAIREAVRLSLLYIHDRFLPGKALNLLDRAGPKALLPTLSEMKPDQPVGREVTAELIRQIVAEQTGIALARLTENEHQKLSNLEARLEKRVKGQGEAIRQIAGVLKQAQARLSDSHRPQGVLLFAGPCGVGKTELALGLAEEWLGEENAMLRLDMSEYIEKHQISRLIGAPPGCGGHEAEGSLTGYLRHHPYGVILLHEIEKAHPDVQHLLQALFDTGRLKDAYDRSIHAKNAIFILTTTLGSQAALAQWAAPLLSPGETLPSLETREERYRKSILAAIRSHFSSRFCNCFDAMIVLPAALF